METSLIDTVLTSISAHTVLKPTSTTSELPYKYNDVRACGAHAKRSRTRPMGDGVPPSGTQRTHSTPSRDDGVEHRYLPRSALRASLGRLKRSQAVGLASAPGWKRRTRGRAGIGASLRAARVARTPQTQPGGRRAEACCATGRLPGCGARAFKRSLAEVVRNGAFGGRTLARALPRSYDRAWA